MNISFNYISRIPFSRIENWSSQYLLDNHFGYNDKYPLVSINSFLSRNKTPIDVLDDATYKRVTIKTNNGGVLLRDIKKGIDIGTKKQFVISEGQFILSKIDARNGAFGVVSREIDKAIITGNFWAFDVDFSIINPHFLSLITTTSKFIQFCENASNGTTNRLYLQESLFLQQKIPLPSIKEQNEIVEEYNNKILLANQNKFEAETLEKGIEKYLFSRLGLSMNNNINHSEVLHIYSFKNIKEWGVDKILNKSKFKTERYNFVTLESNPELYFNINRGKSPKYSSKSKYIILNQKCNRWNNLDLEYVKTVDEKWYKAQDSNTFTKEGDVLINSTGEGTIGRATCIEGKYSNFLYDSHLLLLRFEQKLVNPTFFTYLFNSSFGQEQVDDLKSAQSTKQTELGVNNLLKIQFPIVPLSKQNEIVKHISEIKRKIIQLKKEALVSEGRAIIDFEKEIFF